MSSIFLLFGGKLSAVRFNLMQCSSLRAAHQHDIKISHFLKNRWRRLRSRSASAKQRWRNWSGRWGRPTWSRSPSRRRRSRSSSWTVRTKECLQLLFNCLVGNTSFDVQKFRPFLSSLLLTHAAYVKHCAGTDASSKTCHISFAFFNVPFFYLRLIILLIPRSAEAKRQRQLSQDDGESPCAGERRPHGEEPPRGLGVSGVRTRELWEGRNKRSLWSQRWERRRVVLLLSSYNMRRDEVPYKKKINGWKKKKKRKRHGN